MDGYHVEEHPTHSFVMRIWIEQVARPGRPATWRGHITHVQSGDRRSVDSLAGIERFVGAHLAPSGIRVSVRDRLRLAAMRAVGR
jgi:hypothetical protein